MTPLRLLAAVLLGVLLLGCARVPATRVTHAPAPPPSPVPAAPAAVELLRAWDAARSRAWARGDPHRLAALYVPGSRAGARDLAMLRAYTARGLRVRHLATQLLSVRVTARTPTTRTLLVTDRLAAGTITGPDLRRPLPRDGPTTRTVRLRLLDGRWLVAAVRPGR